MVNREVFISYARKDGDGFARELERRIENQTELRTKAFFDKSDLDPGIYWERRIDKAIEDCFVMILVLTEGARDSTWVTYEWATASAKGKPIIPLVSDKKISVDDKKLHGKLKEFQLEDRRFISLKDTKEEDWEWLLGYLETVYHQTFIPQGVQRAIEAAEDWQPLNRAEAINFLEEYEHRSTFDALLMLCDSFHQDTVIRASIALAKKLLENTSFETTKPGYTREELLAKAVVGIGMAITYSQNSGVARVQLDSGVARGLLVKADTEEAIVAMKKAFDRSDQTTKDVLIKNFLRFKNVAIVPILRDVYLTHDIRRRDVITRLVEFFHDAESLLLLEDRVKNSDTPLDEKLRCVALLQQTPIIDACLSAIRLLKHYILNVQWAGNPSHRNVMSELLQAIDQQSLSDYKFQISDVLMDGIEKGEFGSYQKNLQNIVDRIAT